MCCHDFRVLLNSSLCLVMQTRLDPYRPLPSPEADGNRGHQASFQDALWCKLGMEIFAQLVIGQRIFARQHDDRGGQAMAYRVEANLGFSG